MYTLQIEHGVKDFQMWKRAYGADPLGRAGSGVLAERIYRPVDNEHYVALDLDFASRGEAAEFLDRLRSSVWSTPAASPERRDVERLVHPGPERRRLVGQ